MKLGRKKRLKSNEKIKELFLTGAMLKSFPLRFRYLPNSENSEEGNHQLAVTVSKRKFKRAVDRNRIKRLLRESYRTQSLAFPKLQSLSSQQILLVYTANKICTQQEVSAAMALIFKQLIEQLKKQQVCE